MAFPAELRYTDQHEWARQDGGTVTVGITSYATDQLGDVVFVELPAVGRKLEAMKPFGLVEAVKTVSDLYAPVGGEVLEVNTALVDNPALVNQEPFGQGWMIRLKPDRTEDWKGLLSSSDYEKLVEAQHA